MYLGIEIGGTKLQLGVGDGEKGVLKKLERRSIDRSRGAEGILAQIAEAGLPLVREFGVRRVGYGFGGPVDHANGLVRISHQVEGWAGFPLSGWTQEQLGLPATLGNDCDVAALAEYRYGAGRGAEHVFYVTVGTGVGGGCVLGGKLLGSGRPAIAEIGHLRPGIECTDSHSTVESIAAGPGIAAFAKHVLALALEQPLPFVFEAIPSQSFMVLENEVEDLRGRSKQSADGINGVILGRAAIEGNGLAKAILERPVRTLGWAIAQVITLVAPEVVVVGGGVSLLGEELFFAPLRERVAEYGFPPLSGSYCVVPAALGEEAVVHGAVALAAMGEK